MNTVFLRVIDSASADKARALLDAIRTPRDAFGPNRFELDPRTFTDIPRLPFAYWVSAPVRDAFASLPVFESGGRAARQGGVNGDDFRWLRLWTETPFGAQRNFYVPIAKGGHFSPYYADLLLECRWDLANETFFSFTGLQHRPQLKPASGDFYFRAGLTWPRRTDGLSFRVMPRGCIFADKGPAVFVGKDMADELLAYNALLNSRVFGYLVSVQIARTELAQSYEVGLIQQTPIPNLTGEGVTTLARLGRRAWALKRSLDASNETSHAFLLPSILNERVTAWDRPFIERELAAVQKKIDEAAYTLYGIAPKDRSAIEAAYKENVAPNTSEDEKVDDSDEVGENEAAVGVVSDTLNSWLVGVAFGRFDPRLATGERSLPHEPEPFDPLPQRSPGMWPEGEEAERRSDILVDDEGHIDDLVVLTRAAAERVHVDAPENLRVWLAREFFSLHIKMYSKSRRKAPIYWQLATPSARYAVWLYIHKITKDTLFRVQSDYAAPKLAHEERRLESLKSELGDGGTSMQRRELAAQELFVEELRAFVEEVRRVAPLWNPNLDDGVIINFAPLWRLVPQHKFWQKELKATWDSLCAGGYDWAHLGMHLWPDRVVPKCATDRSLAIAHGLEDVFWVEGEDGKWKPRKTPTRPIRELVAERSSEAVKAALNSLLDAPDPSGSTKRGRKSKAA
jgi:hypothetical protein